MAPRDRLVRSSLAVLILALMGPVSAGRSDGQAVPDVPPAAEPSSPQPRRLSEADSRRVDDLNESMDALCYYGDLAGAAEPARQIVAVLERVLGTDDWRTADARRQVKTLETIAGLPEEGRRAMADVPALVQSLRDLCARASYESAEGMGRRSLEVRRRWLGEDHPDTAYSYSNLGGILGAQGRLAEAEAMHRKALAIWLKSLGEGHPDTAYSYNNLANVLRAQGRPAEAEAMHRKALAIWLKSLGEGHTDTADTCKNLANDLLDQGRPAEAEAMHRKALAIRLRAVRENHPDIAGICNNLANDLFAQGRLAEAEAMHRKALAIWREALGEDHPDTAYSYSNLAGVLGARGRLAEAEAMHRKALAIRLKSLGESHPDTAYSYAILGEILDRLGRADEARDALAVAADADELARLRGLRGLAGAAQSRLDPAPALALALAGAGRPADAWTRWERGLARALLEEAAGRAARPLDPGERAHQADLLGRGQALDEQIGRLAGRPGIAPDDEVRLDELRRRAGEARRELLEFQQALEKKYGPLAGRPVAFEELRAVLPQGTAVVGWVDTSTRHAACVVRRSGGPAWITLPGTGKDGAWTEDDVSLARRLRGSLGSTTLAGWRPLAGALARQRLGPLGAELEGVRRLVMVNSPGLAGVPLEVLLAARDGATPAVAYVPSGSMLVHLARQARPAGRPTLLALGDPAYPEPVPGPEVDPTPPGHGLLVTAVEPHGNADLGGIRPGDVLLKYDGVALRTRDELKVVADGGPRRVAVWTWRAGKVRAVELAAGPLGVELDPRPAAPAVLANRAAREVLLGNRGESWARLPGTRREVAAIAGLFPPGDATTLLGGDARESVLQDLARSGRLGGFAYLHLAAHGRYDPTSAWRTALILAPDPDRPADPAAFEADGEISAEQIGRTWELDAELVALSACESALGPEAGGEGFLGFAQPLLARGARSLVLGLWKVDDRATALLMERFYRNLLGRREDGRAAMPKAEALSEAKAWLRTRSAAGDPAPRGAPRVSKTGAAPAAVAEFSHPYYWAGFILIGNPD